MSKCKDCNNTERDEKVKLGVTKVYLVVNTRKNPRLNEDDMATMFKYLTHLGRMA